LSLAVLGSAGSGFLGILWLGQAEALKPAIDLTRREAKNNPKAMAAIPEWNTALKLVALQKALNQAKSMAAIQEFDTLHRTSYFLLAGLGLGILGGVLAVCRRGVLAALLLIVAFAGPAVLARDWLLENTDTQGSPFFSILPFLEQDNLYPIPSLRPGDRIIGLAMFTGALLLAGLLAFLIRPKKVIREDV